MYPEQKKIRPISFTLVFVGLLFFFNPHLAVLDIFPDSIGCFLIFLGLTRVSRISFVMEEARAKFLKLLALNAAKDVIVMVSLSGQDGQDRPTLLLIIAFVFAILEIWLGFSALRSLFDGFYGLAVKLDCTALYAASSKPRLIFSWVARRSATERMLRRAMLFLAIREIFCALPEFSALSTSVFNTLPNQRIWYDYIGAMRALSVVFVFIFSVFYVVFLSRYFYLVAKQKQFRYDLAQKECHYAVAHPGNAVERRYRLSFILLSVGGFLLTDFYLDFTNIIPDFIGAALMLAGVLCTDIHAIKKAICAVGVGIFGTMATVSGYFASHFSNNFSIGDITKTAEGKSAYTRMWGSALAEFLLFLVALALLLLLLRSVIEKWAGYIATHSEEEFEKKQRARFLEEFDSSLIRVFIVGFFSGVFSFVYDYMQEIPGGKWFRFLEFFWAYDFCMALAFATVFSALLSGIYKQIKYRFSLGG